MQHNPKQRKAYLLALLSVLFWSTMSSAFKITLRYIGEGDLLFWSVLSGIVVLGILYFSGKNRRSWRNLSIRDLLSSALMGFFNPFLYYLVLFKAYKLLEAQEAGTLNYLWPVVLVLFSMIFLGEKIKLPAIGALFISFFGIIIIGTAGRPFSLTFSNSYGVMLAVGSAFIWAAYWILNMKDSREETGKILLNLIFGVFYLLIYFGVRHQWPVFPGREGLAGSLYIGTFELSLTFVIWLKALTLSSDTAKVSNLIYLSPFLALFWIQGAVGEKIHGYTLVGLIFIVGGIILQQSYTRRLKGR